MLADADESNAGIASGVNNAIARVAGLVAIAAVGAVVAASFGSKLENEVGAAALARPAVAKAVAGGREAAAGHGVGAGRAGGRAGLGGASRPRTPRWAPSTWASASPTALVALGGLLGLLGITNPRRKVAAADCAGGQLVGHPEDATRQSPCDWGDQARADRGRR